MDFPALLLFPFHFEGYRGEQADSLSYRLEEAAMRLRELVTTEEFDSDVRLRLVTALSYIDKAVEVLRLDATQGPGGA